MRYKYIFVPLVMLALAACRKSVPETPPIPDSRLPIPEVTIVSPTRLEDRPLCGLVARDQPAPWRQYWRSSYSNSGVSALLKDEQWLWAGTPQGLVRLDLETLDCTVFERTGTDPDVSLTGVQALALDPRGCLWVAKGGDKVARYCDDRDVAWQPVLLEHSTYRLSFDAEGNFWSYRPASRGVAAPHRYAGHEPPVGQVWQGELVSKGGRTSDCVQWFSKSRGETGNFSFQSPQECRALALWRQLLPTLKVPSGLTPIEPFPPLATDGENLWTFARYAQAGAGQPEQYALLHLTEEQLVTEGWQGVLWPSAVPEWGVNMVADEARAGVWVGSPDGLFFSDGEVVQKLPLSAIDLVPSGPHVFDLAVDEVGRLWAATAQGLWRWDEGAGEWGPTAVDDQVFIAPDVDGGLWAISQRPAGSLGHFDGQRWQHYPKPANWACSPRDLAADEGGGLWLTSFSCDLQGFDGQNWAPYGEGVDLEGALLARGPDGVLYAAQALRPSGQVWRYDGADWQALPEPDSELETSVTALVADGEDNLWAGYWPPPAVRRFDGQRWQAFPIKVPVYTLFLDAQGGLWVGGEQKVFHYDGETWHAFDLDDAIVALTQDRQGRIWAGGQKGLYVYEATGD